MRNRGDSAQSPGDGSEGSILTQFRPELFVSHRSWLNLKRILGTEGGGSYGLAGPRGAGKTWMMEKALSEARQQDGIGVWFPSPSEYEPTAFLAALSDVVATHYQRYYDNRTRRTTRVANNRFIRNSAVGLLFFLLSLWVLNQGEGQYGFYWLNTTNLLWIIPFSVGAYLLGRAVIRFFQEQRGLGRVRSEAEELRQQVRYTMSTSENTEFGVDGSYGGIGAKLKRARERQLVERPATLSSFIHNFRSFAEAMADEVEGPVVIAIDELDKMSDPPRVAQLFRDIKGIFDIPGIYFLVSLSDEAARALDLGGVRTRNEFNSSFYTVISLPRLSPHQCFELLKKRDPTFDHETSLVIGVLSGGVSREVARIGELVRAELGKTSSVCGALEVMMAEELDAFGDQVLSVATAGEGAAVSEAAQVGFFDRMSDFKSALSMGVETFSMTCRQGWSLNGTCPGWREHLEEEWRRLLVRLSIAWYLGSHPAVIGDTGGLTELQGIVRTTAGSAAVGRSSFEAFLTTGEDILRQENGSHDSVREATVSRDNGPPEDGDGRVRFQLSLPGGRTLWLTHSR
jgi:KAP family P-loop domain